jgi:predicted RNase H-like HicB family nuclease
MEEAKKMLADAISCYLKRMKEHGECSPDDSKCIVDEISIADE